MRRSDSTASSRWGGDGIGAWRHVRGRAPNRSTVVTITLVAAEGVPPLRFGMSFAVASEAMRAWGTVTVSRDEDPSQTTISAHDDQYLWDIHANFEDGERVTSITV